MALIKIKDFNSNYQEEVFGGEDIKSYSVYADISDEKVGTIDDLLVDETGRIRYVVVDTGFWIFGKKVLLPIGRCRIDFISKRLYALGFTREGAEALPEYDEGMVVDYDYEERVRTNYRGSSAPTPVASAPAELAPTSATSEVSAPSSYSRDSYSYDKDPDLYNTKQEDHGPIRLYEERLIANKERNKTGEVRVGKTVATETATASVPVEKERIVVERHTPSNAGEAITPGEADFREGEVARIEVYEETADITKQAFVREEVNVKKVVDRDLVTSQETLRREELDLDVEGNPTVTRND